MARGGGNGAYSGIQSAVKGPGTLLFSTRVSCFIHLCFESLHSAEINRERKKYAVINTLRHFRQAIVSCFFS